MADDFGSSVGAGNLGTVAIGASANGNLEAGLDRDWFRVTLVAGQSYIFNMDRGSLGDPFLVLRDHNGVDILGNDDISGANLNSQIRFTATLSGTYYLEAFSSDGSDTGTYTVRAAIDPSPPASNDDYGAQAGSPNVGTVAIGGSTTGNLETLNDRDWFAVTLVAGTSYSFRQNSGTLADPLLRLRDGNGILIAGNDDGGGGLNSLITYTAVTTGVYYLEANTADAGNAAGTGTYTVSAAVNGSPPPPPVDDFGSQVGAGNLGSVAVGSSSTGLINFGGDHDWFAVTLSAGSSYRIRQEAGTLADPRFTLRNSIGVALTGDDDSGGGQNAQVDFTAPASGVYYIDANSADGNGTGNYTVRVTLLYGAPVIATNTGSTAAEGAADIITASELSTTDADSAASAIIYSLTSAPTNGTLTRNGATIALNGTFTQADINSNLIVYNHNGSETTGASFGFSVTDGTTSFTGRTFAVAVTPVNDAPVNTVPGTTVNGTEDTPMQAISGLQVGDVDAGASALIVTLSVTRGTLLLNTGVAGGVTSGQVTGNGTATVTITASQAAINTTLAAAGPAPLSYSPNLNSNGADTLTVTTNDQGATGSGGARQDQDTRAISIAAVNDAPTVAGDGNEGATTISEDVPSASGQSVSALFGPQFSDATDQVPGGSSANTLLGVAIVANGSGAAGQWQWLDGATWTDIGAASQAAAKTFAAATALRFNPAANFNGTAPTLTAHLVDNSSGALTNGGTVNISGGGATGGTTRYSNGTVVLGQQVTAVNDAPVNTVPGTTVTGDEEESGRPVTGLSISDVDAGGGNVVVTLSVQHGSLLLRTDSPGGVTAGQITGNGTGTITITAPVAAINISLSFIQLPSPPLSYTPSPNFNGADTLTITTNDLGASGSGGALSDQDSRVISIAAVNDRPVASGSAAMTAIVEDSPGAGQTVASLFAANFSDSADDQTAVGGGAANTLAGIGVTNNGSNASGTWEYFDGGVWNAIGAASLFAAKSIRADTLVRFNPAPNFNGPAPTLTARLIDSSGGALVNGTTFEPDHPVFTRYSSGSVVLSQAVTAVDDLPTAVADAFATDENVILNVAAGSGILSNDTDPDAGPKTVASINGVGANVGAAVTLASGAKVTVNADGSLSYDPNGAYNYLVPAGSGAVNTSAVDSFTYALNGGSSTTVNVTVNGVAGPGDQLRGTPGADTITGTTGNDAFRLQQGGDDIANGGNGDDGFYFGAAFTGADQVDGGAGTNDQIGLQGNYAALSLTSAMIANVEVIALLSGSITTFGDTANNFYDYNITVGAGVTAANNRLTIQGTSLRVGEDFTFNGSASSIDFIAYGGLGVDNLTGGSGNDGFYFGEGRFSSSDTVNGGAGTNDQLGLDGNYGSAGTPFELSGANINGIEVVALLQFTGAPLKTYFISTNNSLVGAGQNLTIWALPTQTGVTVDGSAETDGRFTFFGGAGADRFTGGTGGDSLTGGGGADTFAYTSANQSTGFNFDQLIGFDDNADKIDLPGGVASFAGPATGSLSLMSFNADLAAGVNAALGPNQAIVFTANGGDLAGRIFGVVDANGDGNYTAGTDFVFEFVAPVTPIDQVGMFI